MIAPATVPANRRRHERTIFNMIELKNIIGDARITFENGYSFVLRLESDGSISMFGDKGMVCFALDTLCNLHVEKMMQKIKEGIDCCAICKYWELNEPGEQDEKYHQGAIVKGICHDPDTKSESKLHHCITSYDFKCGHFDK